ncbi:MAG: malonyl-ACP O-methyltransferase BioC [Cyanobacteria bacterium SIG32]|nr:malonyl-ACP O-methyltransferase BioC [Cyanobacteria bacterium SIG32]
MQLNTKSIKSHFEKSMDKYDENAIVQMDSAEKLTFALTQFTNKFENVLELGCGTGILTQKLALGLSFSYYYANDLVEKSKNYVSNIIPENTFLHGNAIKIKTTKKMDLIISNAMFQWFSNLEDIINHCKSLLNKDGILAFSTFGVENFSELKDLSGLSLNYLTKEQIENILKKDFDILHIEEYTYTLEFNNPLELLAHMKNTGVNSLTSKTWTVKEVKNFCEKYLQKYESVKLTYNPIIVIAKAK